MENSRYGVPDELMRKLHEATERFHASRKRLEREAATPEYEHDARIGSATEELHRAELEIEDIEAQIKKVLATP